MTRITDNVRQTAIARLIERHPDVGNQFAWLAALDKAVQENPAIDEHRIISYWTMLSDANRLTAVMNPLLGLVLEEKQHHI